MRLRTRGLNGEMEGLQIINFKQKWGGAVMGPKLMNVNHYNKSVQNQGTSTEEADDPQTHNIFILSIITSVLSDELTRDGARTAAPIPC